MAQGNAQEKTTAEPDPLITAMNTIMSLSPETEASIRARQDKRTITADTAARRKATQDSSEAPDGEALAYSSFASRAIA